MDKRFQWTEFYMELASALLHYKNNRSDLIAKLKTIFADAGMNFPFKERGKEVYEDICPFTVFGSFNKGITNALKPYIYTLGMRFYSATILMTAYLHPKF